MNSFASLLETTLENESTIGPFVVNPVVVAILIVALPIYRIVENCWGKPSTHIDARRNFYLRTMIAAWLATVLVLLTASSPSFAFTVPGDAPNFIRNGNWSDVVPIFFTAIGLAALPMVAWSLNRNRAKQFAQTASYHSRYIRPENRTEIFWMAGVAISMAFFHEILFRSCLLHFFVSLSVPFWLAIGIGCVIYSMIGFDFSARSFSGAALTSVFAAVMFCLFISVNSLWLPIIVHALCRMACVLIPFDETQTVHSKTL